MRHSRKELIASDAIAGAAALLLACAGPVAHEAPQEPPVAPDAVRVRLVFGAAADLDLYVTGPSQESVYFGNPTSRDGGELLADRRCDAPAPRVETIAFARAAPGRYRVGVDFMIRCATGVDTASYELIAELPGRPPIRQRADAAFGSFAPRALEFEVVQDPTLPDR
jgi:hypothetical protein